MAILGCKTISPLSLTSKKSYMSFSSREKDPDKSMAVPGLPEALADAIMVPRKTNSKWGLSNNASHRPSKDCNFFLPRSTNRFCRNISWGSTIFFLVLVVTAAATVMVPVVVSLVVVLLLSAVKLMMVVVVGSFGLVLVRMLLFVGAAVLLDAML